MVKTYSPNQVQKNILKRTFWEIATRVKLASILRLFLYKDSYLVEQGWFKSVKLGKSVEGTGAPIPWLTYPLINFLEGRLNKSLDMFEYGSGNSTLWFAKHVKSITSLEHDKEWYETISKSLPANAKIMYVAVETEENYSTITFKKCIDEVQYSLEILDTSKKYDVILIDGVYRNNSIVNAISALTSTGIIIVDNIDYTESKEGCDYLMNKGFKCIEFWGMCPIAHHDSCTGIFINLKIV